jgi:hypothetical protein
MTEHLERARWEQVKKETGDAGPAEPEADRRRAQQTIAQTEEGAS